MAEKTTRSEGFKLRLSPAEHSLLHERATAAGLKVAEFIRRECGIGHFGRADLRRSVPKFERPEPVHVVPELKGEDFDQRVLELSRTMPRRNAEQLVRREEARRKAKEAVSP